MGLDALLEKLDADARREREEILSRAAGRAEALREEAEAHLKRTRSRALDRARAQEEAEARKQIGEARTEARRIVFQARHDLLGRIRAATEERIEGASQDEEYRTALPDEVDAVLRRAPAGALRVRAASELVEGLRDALSEALERDASAPMETPRSGDRAGAEGGSGAAAADAHTVEVVPDDHVSTGFLVVGAVGAVIIDATLPARLERAWPAETMRLVQELDS